MLAVGLSTVSFFYTVSKIPTYAFVNRINSLKASKTLLIMVSEG